MATADASAAPPLERITPYVVSGASTAASIVSTLAGFFTFLISKIFNTLGFFSPVPVIVYLLAPLFVFFGIATDVLIRWPYQISLYAFDAFHPIYVFCGVACIVGGLVGITGRLVTNLLVEAVCGMDEPAALAQVKKGKQVARQSGGG